MIFRVDWPGEDATAVVRGRLTSAYGTGAATGVSGEGNWIKQADLTSITWKMFDASSTTPDTAIATGTFTISSVVIDTPVTSTANWTGNSVGYNFLAIMAASNFPTGGHQYELEVTVTTTGGYVQVDTVAGRARAIRGS